MCNMHYPILIYDNLCTSCTNFARVINYVFGGKITMLGHYTAQGKEFKETIFPENYDGTEMSWFVTEKKAYGGRKRIAAVNQIHILRKAWGICRERV